MTGTIDAQATEAGLTALRKEIDAIDLALHENLVARGEIIDRLIAAKAAAGGGSAFRPAREAAMMRALVERHRGILPLDTVEGIWRIIISTFTYVQKPYRVHADVSGGDAAVRDSARFHFGFTVPLDVRPSPAAVLEAVAAAVGDLGLLPVAGRGDPWWDALREPDAPKIIARLPFVERAGHAAGLPLLVVAKPLADAAPQDVLLWAATVPNGAPPPREATVVAQAAGAAGTDVLLATTGTGDSGVAALRGCGATRIARVGSHAARYDLERGIIDPRGIDTGRG